MPEIIKRQVPEAMSAGKAFPYLGGRLAADSLSIIVSKHSIRILPAPAQFQPIGCLTFLPHIQCSDGLRRELDFSDRLLRFRFVGSLGLLALALITASLNKDVFSIIIRPIQADQLTRTAAAIE